MPRRRDVGDDLAELVAIGIFAVYGAIASFFLGRELAKKLKKQEQLALTYPDTLELNHDHTYVAPVLGTKAKIDALRAGCNILISPFSFSVAVALVIIKSEPLIAMCPAIFSILSLFSAFRFWRKYNGKTPRLPVVELRPVDFSAVRIYTVKLPRSTVWHAQTAAHFMQDILHKMNWQGVFQIVGDHERVSWQIIDLRQRIEPAQLKQAIQVFYPDASIAEDSINLKALTSPFYRCLIPFEQIGPFILPILRVEELTPFDPLVSLTHEMSALLPGERIIHTLFVADFAKFIYDQIDELITVKLPTTNSFEAGYDWESGGRRVDRYNREDQEHVKNKIQNLSLQCLLLMQIEAPTQERVMQLYQFRTHITRFQKENFLNPRYELRPENIYLINNAAAAMKNSMLGLLDQWLTNASRRWQNFRLILWMCTNWQHCGIYPIKALLVRILYGRMGSRCKYRP